MNTNAPPPPRPPLPAPIATFQGRPALYSAFGVTFQLDLLTRSGRLPSRSIPLVDSTPTVVVASKQAALAAVVQLARRVVRTYV
jgi:hypothetical protein